MSSIYIPFVDCDADETFMGAVLGLAKLGEIERIDFVMDRQQQRRSAYVHFVNRCEGTGFWLDAFRGALDRGECVKIFHGHRAYWKCIKSRTKKPTHERPPAPEMQDGLAVFKYLCSLHPQWNRQQDGTLVFGPRAWAEASGRTYATNDDDIGRAHNGLVGEVIDGQWVSEETAEPVEFPWRGRGGDLGPGNRTIDDRGADASNDDEVDNQVRGLNQEIRGLNQEIVAEREQALERVFVDAPHALFASDLKAAQEALMEARHKLATAEADCAAHDAEIRKKQAIQKKLKPYLEAALKLEKLTQLSHTLHQAEKVDDLLRRWKRLMEIIRKCQSNDRVPEREETNEMDELLKV